MAIFIAAHASGRPLTGVAEDMHYSYANIRNTLDEAKMRAGCSTLAQLAMYAHREGYITDPTGPGNVVFACAPS
jgi:DNA-binding NarL/FixJ family response regulator